MHPGEVVLMGHLSPVAMESDPRTTCQANKMHLFNPVLTNGFSHHYH